MARVKILEGGHVIQELSIEDAVKLIEEKIKEGMSPIIDGVYVADTRNIRELLKKSKEGVTFFPLVGGGRESPR